MIYATTWMDLKSIMLCERIQIKRPSTVLFQLYEMSRIGKSTGTGIVCLPAT